MHKDGDAGRGSRCGKRDRELSITGAASPGAASVKDANVGKRAVEEATERIGGVGLNTDRLCTLTCSRTGGIHLQGKRSAMDRTAHNRIPCITTPTTEIPGFKTWIADQVTGSEGV